ncbi:MAG: hypothetical protein AAF215_31250 [Cyanobacteria bacterium P01_A01_bin.123]
MVRLLTTLVVSAVVIAGLSDRPSIAQNCRAGCESDQIQFTPGQQLTIEIINRAPHSVQFSQMAYMNPQSLAAYGGLAVLEFGAGTRPNVDLYVWEENAEPLNITLARPASNVLRVEVTAAPYGPGDRAITIADDGRVLIY